MAYERDKDRDTRGVGAIAALDKGNRHRAAVRRARAQRLNSLDRKLAAYTYRPGGGMGALGMINLGFTKQVGVGTGSGVGERTPGASRPPVARPPTTSGSGGVTRPGGTSLYGGAGTVLQQPANQTAAPTGSVSTVSRFPSTSLVAGTTLRPGYVLPLPLPGYAVAPVSPTAPSTAGTLTGGGLTYGGSSGGGGGGGSYPTPPPFPGMESPAIPDVPDDPGASSGPDYKKMAMIGGAAVAVWWLFFRKKAASSP